MQEHAERISSVRQHETIEEISTNVASTTMCLLNASAALVLAYK